ncbi:MAG: helix-turn-helix transcriptional regulator [Lachnospiraceae bacterium]|nr:helix-turn-helix transcriptional regulator [Lachnospiraceae bacterium]
MINYEPFWDTLRKKDITKYQLIYHWGISSNTLRRMGRNEPINSNTLNELCLILNCQVQDIIKFEPTDAEIQQITDRKAIITEKFKHKK